MQHLHAGAVGADELDRLAQSIACGPRVPRRVHEAVSEAARAALPPPIARLPMYSILPCSMLIETAKRAVASESTGSSARSPRNRIRTSVPRSSRVSRAGRARSNVRSTSCRVKASRGVANTSYTSPCSSTRPASITATRWQTALMTLISWQMRTMVIPRRALISRSSSRIDAAVSGSSADVGSSHSSTSGWLAIARAMPTRCSWPPDNWAG